MTSTRTSSWVGSELEASGGHLLTLDEHTVAELAAQLPGDLVVPSESDVPPAVKDWSGHLLGPVAQDLTRRVTNGPGLVILNGDGLAELSDHQLTALLYGLSVQMGHPMSQNPVGERIVSVRDELSGDPDARGYRTNKGLLMHTDAADVAGLLCLSQGSSGGGNLFASAEAVHTAITLERPDLLHEYYRLWDWDLRRLERPGSKPTLNSQIFSYFAGSLSCRYASLLLRNGAARAGYELSLGQLAALDTFEDVAKRPELVLRHTLARGESMWINNYQVLHAREAFEDGAESGEVRHLLRTWIWLNEGPELSPAFASPREVY